MKVEIKNKTINQLPSYVNPSDAGADVRADLWNIKEGMLFNAVVIHGESGTVDSVFINPGGRALIPTGIHVSIPEGYEIQVRSRSGLALKQGIVVLNSPGTIDSAYRDEVGVILMNTGNEVFEVKQGDRIAQLVLNKVEHIDWVQVEEFYDKSDRGGGFGHSAIN